MKKQSSFNINDLTAKSLTETILIMLIAFSVELQIILYVSPVILALVGYLIFLWAKRSVKVWMFFTLAIATVMAIAIGHEMGNMLIGSVTTSLLYKIVIIGMRMLWYWKQPNKKQGVIVDEHDHIYQLKSAETIGH